MTSLMTNLYLINQSSSKLIVDRQNGNSVFT